jgi:hypothetical protein
VSHLRIVVENLGNACFERRFKTWNRVIHPKPPQKLGGHI